MLHFRHEKEKPIRPIVYIVYWRDSRFSDIIDLKTNGLRDNIIRLRTKTRTDILKYTRTYIRSVSDSTVTNVSHFK